MPRLHALRHGLAPFISSSMLLVLRLYTARWVVQESRTKKIAHSAYMVELTSYNVIDPDVVATKGKYFRIFPRYRFRYKESDSKQSCSASLAHRLKNYAIFVDDLLFSVYAAALK